MSYTGFKLTKDQKSTGIGSVPGNSLECKYWKLHLERKHGISVPLVYVKTNFLILQCSKFNISSLHSGVIVYSFQGSYRGTVAAFPRRAGGGVCPS